MNASSTPLKIEVFFSLREDGGLRAWSTSVPELMLSNANADQVMADVPLALEVILSAKHGRPIKVAPGGDCNSVMDEIRAQADQLSRAAAHEFTAIAA